MELCDELARIFSEDNNQVDMMDVSIIAAMVIVTVLWALVACVLVYILHNSIKQKDNLSKETYALIKEKDAIIREKDKEKDALIREKDKEKDALIREKDKEKNTLIREKNKEKDALIREKDKEKDAHIREKNILIKEKNKTEIENLKLKQCLENTKLEYLHATKKLSARGALELFQRRYVFRNKKQTLTAEEKWKLFLNEDLGKEFERKMLESKCNTPVHEIAARVYGAVSDGIHNYFDEGMRKIYLIKSEFSRCDLVFLQTVCSSIPLSPSDVVILDNKAQFLFSPPGKI